MSYNYKVLYELDYGVGEHYRTELQKDLNRLGKKGYKIDFVANGQIYMSRPIPHDAFKSAWGETEHISWDNEFANG